MMPGITSARRTVYSDVGAFFTISGGASGAYREELGDPGWPMLRPTTPPKNFKDQMLVGAGEQDSLSDDHWSCMDVHVAKMLSEEIVRVPPHLFR